MTMEELKEKEYEELVRVRQLYDDVGDYLVYYLVCPAVFVVPLFFFLSSICYLDGHDGIGRELALTALTLATMVGIAAGICRGFGVYVDRKRKKFGDDWMRARVGVRHGVR